VSQAPSTGSKAQLRVMLTATGWAACITVWFMVMGAIAIWAGDNPLGVPALMAVFLGGVHLLTLLSNTRHLPK